MDQSEREKCQEDPGIGGPSHLYELYLQELNQVLIVNTGEKSPQSSSNRRGKVTILKCPTALFLTRSTLKSNYLTTA